MQNDFYERVYDLIKLIPFGRVTTFGEIARTLGQYSASRLVGRAIQNINKFGNVPIHRVVFKNGGLCKKFALGGVKAQKHLLESEGIEIKRYRVDLQKYGFYFW